MYKTIKERGSSEIVEKKSKFIANLFYVEDLEEADKIIKEYKRIYHDARHNCYAYRILGDNGIIEKSCDDGEPSGTAGAPMLNIISKQDIVNVLVIVTRYFGGILLGTGGLVKAYSTVTKNALEDSELIEIEEGFLYEVELKYSDLESFKYFIKNNNIKLKKEEYFENVKLRLFVPKNRIECMKNEKINDFNILKLKEIEKTRSKIS